MHRIPFILIILIFLSPTLKADFEFFRGVRQMGMGGASIGVVNDETALLSNPNGLGRLRDTITTVFDPEVTSSTGDLRPLYGTMGLGALSPETHYNNLESTQGRPNAFKSQFFPSIVMPNFGIGLLGRHEVVATRNSDGTYEHRYQNDYSLNLGYNFSFWGGRVKFGFVSRFINRVEHEGVLDPAVDSLDLGSFAREGQGVSVDMGLTLAAPWVMIPTLSFLVRDVGGTAFSFGSGFFGYSQNGNPAFVAQTVDMAFALFPIFNNESRGAFTVEYMGIDNLQNVQSHMDRLRIGGEVNMWDAFFFRAGYYNNTWTAGFEYANEIIQWQLASYSEKVPVGSLFLDDRRAVVKFAVRF